MFKKKMLLILFLATILIYVVALFWSIHDYQEWKRRDIERLLERYPPEIVGFIDYWRYTETRQGRSMIQLGFAIGLVWVVGIGFLGKYMEHQDLKLLARIIPICGFLCLLFGVTALFYNENHPLGYGVVHPYRDYAHPIVLFGMIFLAITPAIWIHARACATP